MEQTFRTAKHLFATRLIFHKIDETIRGHVFGLQRFLRGLGHACAVVYDRLTGNKSILD